MTIATEQEVLEARFHAQATEKIEKHFNAFPNHDKYPLPVITVADPDHITMRYWGMVPVWWKRDTRGLINVTYETLRDKKDLPQRSGRAAPVGTGRRIFRIYIDTSLGVYGWKANSMRIIRIPTDHGERFHLVDGAGEPLPLVAGFVRGLQARGCSPNTIIAYLYDLRRFYQFLDHAGLSLERFVAAHTVDFLAFLNAIQPRQRKASVFPALVRTGLSPTSINRTLAAVSTFYEHLALTGAEGE